MLQLLRHIEWVIPNATPVLSCVYTQQKPKWSEKDQRTNKRDQQKSTWMEKRIKEQERIPVGCIPPACWLSGGAVWPGGIVYLVGVCPEGCLPGGYLSSGCPPRGCLGGVYPGVLPGVSASGCLPRQPPEPQANTLSCEQNHIQL